jgi:plastocyanin
MKPQPMMLTAHAIAWLITSMFCFVQDAVAESAASSQVIFMTVAEIKGSTTTDKLAPPSINPGDLSKGYGYTPPSQHDKNAPHRWEVSSYVLSPGSVTVQKGTTVILNVFVVNGDEHEVQVFSPDGKVVVSKAVWNRGREYRHSFVAEKVGTYQLICSTHAPTMTASIVVLPR